METQQPTMSVGQTLYDRLRKPHWLLICRELPTGLGADWSATGCFWSNQALEAAMVEVVKRGEVAMRIDYEGIVRLAEHQPTASDTVEPALQNLCRNLVATMDVIVPLQSTEGEKAGV